ncbi:MAG TPA: hypothetical protein VMG36_03675 [Thermoplasmata archaeon]|nr:hypothetical protein [Thermoplasmata archaeon]
MSTRADRAAAPTPVRGRCRCGHLPTHHMVVAPAPGGGGYRLDPSGPCQLCGEASCRAYVAAPP